MHFSYHEDHNHRFLNLEISTDLIGENHSLEIYFLYYFLMGIRVNHALNLGNITDDFRNARINTVSA